MVHGCLSDSSNYCARPDAMGCEERVGRYGLSFDSEEGTAGTKDQTVGKEEEVAVRQPARSSYGNRRALLGGRDGGEHQDAAVAAKNGKGYGGGSDPFAAVHATMKLTMEVVGDEEKGVVSNEEEDLEHEEENTEEELQSADCMGPQGKGASRRVTDQDPELWYLSLKNNADLKMVGRSYIPVFQIRMEKIKEVKRPPL
ncbi:hypothetical protein B296_00022835 [Ensete ventricosum]|uniref:Uncharacterized protein n=1 Tax=Ensete ventricosum TaxID=4639 RepID=A0A426ZY91_ENSVE|nr:hypothetical protein B296_00022835 [Ensete ventricosum]